MRQITPNNQTHRTARLYRIAIAVAAALLVTSCSGVNPVFRPTITQQHASDRVEQIVRDTVARITPRPRLELYKPGSNVSGCMVDPSDTADTRVQVSNAYFLRGVRDSNASISEQVLRLWKQAGYAITDTHEVGGAMPSINGVTQDDFYIGLEWTGSGDLSIGATSPCLWPDGTPPPGH